MNNFELVEISREFSWHLPEKCIRYAAQTVVYPEHKVPAERVEIYFSRQGDRREKWCRD